jgi:hypothetical protein
VIIDISRMPRIAQEDDGTFWIETGGSNWNVYEERCNGTA